MVPENSQVFTALAKQEEELKKLTEQKAIEKEKEEAKKIKQEEKERKQLLKELTVEGKHDNVKKLVMGGLTLLLLL